MTDEWRSRIVREAEVPAESLTANPRNFRKHSKAQRSAMTATLDAVGWVQRVIVNETTGNLIDGHLRVEEAAKRGETVPVLYVELSEEEEGVVLASLDPLAAMAGTDRDALAELLQSVSVSSDELAKYLVRAAGIGPDGKPYTQTIESPIYEPSGKAPKVSALVDREVLDALLRDIAAADLSDDVRAFLEMAAYRHVVFHFDRIANFYAHAKPEVQRLMEASALVIVDFDQALERGFVRLNEDVLAAFQSDHPDA